MLEPLRKKIAAIESAAYKAFMPAAAKHCLILKIGRGEVRRLAGPPIKFHSEPRPLVFSTWHRPSFFVVCVADRVCRRFFGFLSGKQRNKKLASNRKTPLDDPMAAKLSASPHGRESSKERKIGFESQNSYPPSGGRSAFNPFLRKKFVAKESKLASNRKIHQQVSA